MLTAGKPEELRKKGRKNTNAEQEARKKGKQEKMQR